jgi:hypothetical protein
VLPDRGDHCVSGKPQDAILLGPRQVRVHDLDPELPFRKPLRTALVEDTEISSVDERFRPELRSQLVEERELSVGVTDQQESHARQPLSRAARGSAHLGDSPTGCSSLALRRPGSGGHRPGSVNRLQNQLDG